MKALVRQRTLFLAVSLVSAALRDGRQSPDQHGQRRLDSTPFYCPNITIKDTYCSIFPSNSTDLLPLLLHNLPLQDWGMEHSLSEGMLLFPPTCVNGTGGDGNMPDRGMTLFPPVVMTVNSHYWLEFPSSLSQVEVAPHVLNLFLAWLSQQVSPPMTTTTTITTTSSRGLTQAASEVQKPSVASKWWFWVIIVVSAFFFILCVLCIGWTFRVWLQMSKAEEVSIIVLEPPVETEALHKEALERRHSRESEGVPKPKHLGQSVVTIDGIDISMKQQQIVVRRASVSSQFKDPSSPAKPKAHQDDDFFFKEMQKKKLAQSASSDLAPPASTKPAAAPPDSEPPASAKPASAKPAAAKPAAAPPAAPPAVLPALAKPAAVTKNASLEQPAVASFAVPKRASSAKANGAPPDAAEGTAERAASAKAAVARAAFASAEGKAQGQGNHPPGQVGHSLQAVIDLPLAVSGSQESGLSQASGTTLRSSLSTRSVSFRLPEDDEVPPQGPQGPQSPQSPKGQAKGKAKAKAKMTVTGAKAKSPVATPSGSLMTRGAVSDGDARLGTSSASASVLPITTSLTMPAEAKPSLITATVTEPVKKRGTKGPKAAAKAVAKSQGKSKGGEKSEITSLPPAPPPSMSTSSQLSCSSPDLKKE